MIASGLVHRAAGTQAWADPATGHVFCLSEGPSAEAVQRVHRRAGPPADEIHTITVTV